jgi:hypothetical protein
MKRPLAWHEECLHNLLQTIYRETRGLAARQDYVDKMKASASIYQYQIERAKNEHKSEFDSEKWCVSKKRRK